MSNKRKSVGDQMGWATAHFQPWVVTLQWCLDRKACGVHLPCEDLRLHARLGVSGKACRDRPPWVLYHDKEFPVAIEMARPVLRQRT